MSACCGAGNDRDSPTSWVSPDSSKTRNRLAKWMRRARELLAWIFPSVMLAMVPKCPDCLAAYVTLWTGLGVSLSMATYLRWMLLFLCIASLLFLIAERLVRGRANLIRFKKETGQCNTR